MLISTVMIVIGILLFLGMLAGLFLAIKALIRYNSNLKRKKTQRQEELDKMKIEDL